MFRQGPSVVPKSGFLLGLTVVLNVGITIAVSRSIQFEALFGPAMAQQRPPLMQEILATIVGMAILVALVYGVLKLFNQQARLFQTVFALFGTNLIFTVVLLLLSPLSTVAFFIFVFMSFGIALWEIAVAGKILAAALDSSMLKGILIYLGMLLVQVLLVLSLFGVGATGELPSAVTT